MNIFIQFVAGSRERVSKLTQVYGITFTGAVGLNDASIRVIETEGGEEREFARVDPAKRKWIPEFGGEWDTVEVIEKMGDDHCSITVTTKEEE